MMFAKPVSTFDSPALHRLSRIAPLGDAARDLIALAVREPRRVPMRRELLIEGRAVPEPMLLVSGWAARVRILADGRRQFLSFLLPGDLIGLCRHDRPLAVSTVQTLTDAKVATVPDVDLPELRQAYAASNALEEAYLLAQITRLGRLNALDRICDLMLEIHERLALADLVQGDSFEVPLTQEMLADALGLTPVHINRMLQQARRDGDLEWRGSLVTLLDPAALSHRLGRTPARVTA
ncbi:Crp/Fnr family transcriptional regulator [Sphingomonas pokkalii]|uniref:Crp/Fnr family transcriptional regulator n=1 Tax=Sphingomonas pokkalii TaxID=2175090 RepID=A0A2U0SD75_9SPHN|nr:Crp/Fnr family transcriptional regulator [Sphingomonas pokkalii]PVX29332.1 Crp/Fnr family transcriptional regulator [Sphingomonas pokkalii]